ncbi:MAG: hypothetical protein ACTSU5_12810, partial [Promethearchaeota archaeon]
MIVGRARGPGSTEHEFEFVTKDPDVIKIGEYVYYEINGGNKKVLARITTREKIARIPDSLM